MSSTPADGSCGGDGDAAVIDSPGAGCDIIKGERRGREKWKEERGKLRQMRAGREGKGREGRCSGGREPEQSAAPARHSGQLTAGCHCERMSARRLDSTRLPRPLPSPLLVSRGIHASSNCGSCRSRGPTLLSLTLRDCGGQSDRKICAPFLLVVRERRTELSSPTRPRFHCPTLFKCLSSPVVVVFSFSQYWSDAMLVGPHAVRSKSCWPKTLLALCQIPSLTRPATAPESFAPPQTHPS